MMFEELEYIPITQDEAEILDDKKPVVLLKRKILVGRVITHDLLQLIHDMAQISKEVKK